MVQQESEAIAVPYGSNCLCIMQAWPWWKLSISYPKTASQGKSLQKAGQILPPNVFKSQLQAVANCKGVDRFSQCQNFAAKKLGPKKCISVCLKKLRAYVFSSWEAIQLRRSTKIKIAHWIWCWKESGIIFQRLCFGGYQWSIYIHPPDVCVSPKWWYWAPKTLPQSPASVVVAFQVGHV